MSVLFIMSSDGVRKSDFVPIPHAYSADTSPTPTKLHTTDDERSLSASTDSQSTSLTGSPRNSLAHSPVPSTPTSRRTSTSSPDVPDLTDEETQLLLMMMFAQQMKAQNSNATLGPSRKIGNVHVNAVLSDERPIGDIISSQRDMPGAARVLYVTAHGTPIPDEIDPQPITTRIRFIAPHEHKITVNPEAEVLLAASFNVTVIQGEDILPGDNDAFQGKNLELSAGTGVHTINADSIAYALPETIHCDIFIPRPGSPPRTIPEIQTLLQEADLHYDKMVISACRGESSTTIGAYISELCETIKASSVVANHDPFADVPSVENTHRVSPNEHPMLERTDSRNPNFDDIIHYLSKEHERKDTTPV